MNAPKRLIFVSVATIWFMVIACGIGWSGSSKLEATPTPEAGVSTLWSDVPPFPKSIPDMEINLSFNKHDSDHTVMYYYTDKQPAEVAAFYTNDLMKEQGWMPQPYDLVNRFSVGHGEGSQTPYGTTSGGCSLGEFHSQPEATCTFSKIDEQGRENQLIISVSLDEEKSHLPMLTVLHYIRSISDTKK